MPPRSRKKLNPLRTGSMTCCKEKRSPFGLRVVQKHPRRGASRNCDFSVVCQQRGKRDLDACGFAHSETEQKASQGSQHLRRACGSKVSFYGQRSEESPRNSALQDVRSPGSWGWTVSGQVKVEANTFRKHSHKLWNFDRRPPIKPSALLLIAN